MTVLPPVFGPVMISRLNGCPRRTSIGTTSRGRAAGLAGSCVGSSASRKRCSSSGCRACRSQSRPSVLTSGRVHVDSRGCSCALAVTGRAGPSTSRAKASGRATLPTSAAQPAQDAADLAVLLALEDDALGAEAGDAGRLDEHRLAGAAGAVDDAGHLVAVVDRDRQDVVVAADGGVGIAEDLAQLGVAEQALDLVLHAFVEVGELLADLRPVRGWPCRGRGRGRRCSR